MPFSLKVTAGAGEGAQFPFDQTEAKLGRTADNDIVVKDAAASRAHCRVYEKGGRYFVEDLKSANGTKCNGALITTPKALDDGDTITIGDVTFTFSLPPPEVGDSTVLKPPAEELDQQATMLRPPLDLNSADAQRERRTVKKMETVDREPRASARLPKLEDEPSADRTDERVGLEVSTTGKTDELSVPPLNEKEDVNATRAFEVPPPSALSLRAQGGAPAAPASTRGQVATVVSSDATVPPTSRAPLKRRPTQDAAADEVVLSAAERARNKREAQSTALGRLAFSFSELPKKTRTAIYAGGGVFAAGLLGLLVMVIAPGDDGKEKKGPEPMELIPMAPPMEPSFGLGEGVTYNRPDQKIFSFSTASPTKVVAILHYQARDISKDEVSVGLNGTELGFIAPDTMEVASRELELLLPPAVVKPRDVNTLVIDNVKNPPGEESWRVWNLWVEVVPIPELSAAETLREAQRNKDNAEKLLALRDVGPDNLFRAWKSFREAWLELESLSGGRDETLYTYVRIKIKELQPQLDARCNQMLLEVQKALNAKRPDLRKAREVLEDVTRYFPTREHRCYNQSRAFLQDLGG